MKQNQDYTDMLAEMSEADKYEMYKQATKELKSIEHLINVNEALKRLHRNKDFKTVIKKAYIQDKQKEYKFTLRQVTDPQVVARLETKLFGLYELEAFLELSPEYEAQLKLRREEIEKVISTISFDFTDEQVLEELIGEEE